MARADGMLYLPAHLFLGYRTADLDQLAKVEVVYETFAGWQKDITECRTFESLPENAQKYVRFIEKFLGVKVEVSRRIMMS